MLKEHRVRQLRQGPQTFAREQQICLLTGTPLSAPLDPDTLMIKLGGTRPSYKTMTQVHPSMKESDFYGRPKEYQHPDC